jgi:hypothetical protein
MHRIDLRRNAARRSIFERAGHDDTPKNPQKTGGEFGMACAV